MSDQAAAPKPALYALDHAQHATILAALRFYQRNTNPDERRFDDIATQDDTITPLGDEDIDGLCEDALNHTGLSVREALTILGDDEPDAYGQAALDTSKDGELETVDPVVVSYSDEGAYVLAWRWISASEAGVVAHEDEDAE